VGQAIGAALAGGALGRLATSPERLAPLGATSVALGLVVLLATHVRRERGTRAAIAPASFAATARVTDARSDCGRTAAPPNDGDLTP